MRNEPQNGNPNDRNFSRRRDRTKKERLGQTRGQSCEKLREVENGNKLRQACRGQTLQKKNEKCKVCDVDATSNDDTNNTKSTSRCRRLNICAIYRSINHYKSSASSAEASMGAFAAASSSFWFWRIISSFRVFSSGWYAGCLVNSSALSPESCRNK